MPPTFAGIVYSQLFVSLPYPKHDFTGKTIIVTGSNVGLGLEAARHLARLNAEKVILAVRSIARGEEARKSIESSTSYGNTVVEVWQLDLSSYDSVNEFARLVNARLPRLDCILSNAAISPFSHNIAEDNEASITVNVVSTFLLALLLLPLLQKTVAVFNVPVHASFVGSEVHGLVSFPESSSEDIFKAVNDDRSSSGLRRRYALSKLLELFLTREFALRIRNNTPSDEKGIIVNYLNPGMCHSQLGREATFLVRIMLVVVTTLLARPTEVGARTLVHAVAAPASTHGKYLSDCKIVEPSKFVQSEEGARTQKRLWEQLMKRLATIAPEVAGLLQSQ